MINDGDVELIQGIYSATLGDRTWQSWLDLLESQFPGVRFALWGQDVQANTNLGILYAGLDSRQMDQWRDYYSGVNAWAPGLLNAPLGVPQMAEQLLEREALFKTEYYNDWIRPQEDIATGVGVTLFADANRFFGITANVRLKDGDKHNPRLKDKLLTLGPHLARAFELSRKVQPVKALISFEAFSEAMPLSVLALNRRGKYCFMNGRARRLISGHPDITLSADGSVQFADDLAQRQLESAVHRILSPQGGAVTVEIAVRLSTSAGQFKVSAVPYPVTTPFPGHHFALDDSAHPAILLFIEEGRVQMKARVLQALRTRFELTPAETDLAWQLYSGMTLSTIALARGISLHTARNHLRNVFEKTSTNKQHQVVRLVADLGREDSLDF